MRDLFTLFAGSGNPELAEAVGREVGVSLGARVIERFPDGETFVRLEQPVRGHQVFILQPTGPPVNDNLVELLSFVDACRRAAAATIIAVVPYFGYARQDKRHGHREPVTASMVAYLLQAVGANHVVTVDLHAAQIEGFFHIPVDCLTAVPTLCEALRPVLPKELIVVSPDEGRVKMATQYAQRLNATVAVLHKRRETATKTRVTHVVGDVRDKACLIIDDMISTGGTIAEAIEALLAAGARPEIVVAATHGPLLESARQKLSQESVRTLLVTDTIAPVIRNWPKLQVVTVAPVIASAIRRLLASESLSNLY
ncbi:MAG TPA: ribose-phosphate pyrophosphokinase [Pyrinomonadaceae bacterium]|nr:ribose-phosphate pyrophosphokinase [Pyrinomonadaceae bacterium]